ncbi:MAG: pyridoxal phosphate-dependent aminotransferase [Fibrobacter sp.]|nr:pyridoxal phosphate-dependent aminotransferase [Fibrobacter sp.]
MKQKDLTPTPFFAELERAKSEVQKDAAAGGLAFIDMTVSSPLRVGLPFDVTPAVDVVKQEFNLWDVNPAGTLKAREAVAEYYRSRGGNFTPGQIILTASTSEAYSILFKAFCNPGDAILTPVPGYPLLDTLAELENLECYPYFLKLRREKAGKDRCGDFRFVLDTDSLLSAPANAKILLLVCPHNPTGHSVSLSEWNEVVRFCEERNLVLVVDEVFGDYRFSEDVRRSWEYGRFGELTDLKGTELAEVRSDGPKCPIVWLNGLSKICGSPQVKLGWMAVYAPEAMRESIHETLEYVADAYLSVSAPAQALAAPMLKQSAAYGAQISERLRQNLAALREKFPSKYCPEILGGWYAVIRLGGDDEEQTLRLLKEKHVLVQPGFFFDFDEDGWIVISLLQEPSVFAEGLQRICS